MRGRSRGIKHLLFGLGGLLTALSLSGCSFTRIVADFDDRSDTPAKQIAKGADAGVSETFQKTYAAQKVSTLRVRDEMGAIEIKPGDDDRDEIRIEATKTVTDRDLSEADLKKLLPKVKIVAHLDGDALVVEADHETEGFPQNAHANVAFVISVPKRLALDLRTDNSPISATGSEGGVTLRTTNGAIELHHLAGSVDVETSNGPIRAQEIRAKTTLKMVTSNGNIDCEAVHADASPLSVTLQNENGPVKYAGDATEVVLHSSNGEITFQPTLFSLVKADIETANAPVTVTLPASLSATIDAETSNSAVKLQGIPDPSASESDSESARRHVVLNGGKAEITVHTSNAAIDLEAL